MTLPCSRTCEDALCLTTEGSATIIVAISLRICPVPSAPLSPVYTPPSSPPGDSELTVPNFPTRRTKPLDIPQHSNHIVAASYSISSLPSPRRAYDHWDPPTEILRHGKHAQQSSNQNQSQNQNQNQSSSKSSKAQPAAPQQTQPPQQQYQPQQQQAYYDNTMPSQGLSANQGESAVGQGENAH